MLTSSISVALVITLEVAFLIAHIVHVLLLSLVISEACTTPVRVTLVHYVL